MPKTRAPFRSLAAALALAALFAAACGDGGTDSPPPVPTVSVEPGNPTLEVGDERVFTATLRDPDGNPIPGYTFTWRTSDAAVAEVTAQGVVRARAAGEATITAAADGIEGSTRAVVVLGEPRLLWREWTPRAVDPARDDSATLTVVVRGRAPASAVIARPGAPAIPLVPAGEGVWRARMAVSDMAAGYRAGTGHNFIGHLRFDGASSGGWIVGANVRDGGMPDVPVEALAADAQASPYVFNLRWDEPYLGRRVPQPVVQRLYDFFPDDYDWVMTVEPVVSPHNRFFARLRNDVEGIGLAPLDVGQDWGSAARLKGLVHFPIDEYFDMGETVASHEIGHQWIKFIRDIPALAPGGSHWPISTLAYGVMGFALPDGAGGPFPYRLVPIEGGDLRVEAAPVPKEYSDLELYLMGLAPIEEVGEHFILANQDQLASLRPGGVLRGPIVTLRGADVVAAYGSRKPAYGQAQTDFRAAVIVLSRGRLLTPREMAFFDHMAARGEATTELPYALGLVWGTTKPFHLATRRRATLTTRLR